MPRSDDRPTDRWWQEHSEIDALLCALESALGRADAPDAGARLDALREAMEAHFSFEETIYFPIVEKLCPTQHGSVEDALWGHRTVRALLANLQSSIAKGDLIGSREQLSSLATHVGAHEQLELGMIAALQRASGA